MTVEGSLLKLRQWGLQLKTTAIQKSNGKPKRKEKTKQNKKPLPANSGVQSCNHTAKQITWLGSAEPFAAIEAVTRSNPAARIGVSAALPNSSGTYLQRGGLQARVAQRLQGSERTAARQRRLRSVSGAAAAAATAKGVSGRAMMEAAAAAGCSGIIRLGASARTESAAADGVSVTAARGRAGGSDRHAGGGG